MDYQGTQGNDKIDQVALGLPDFTTILTNGGNDFVLLGKGTTYVNAAGSNTIQGTSLYSAVAYWNAPGPIFADLETGQVKNAFGGIDQLTNIHTIHVTGNNTIYGSNVNDRVYLLGSGNFVDGRAGNNTAIFYNKRSTDYNISYAAAEDAFVIFNKATGFVENKLKNIDNIEFSGPDSDNTSRSLWELRNTSISGFSATQVHLNFSVARTDLVADSLIPGDFNGDGNIDFAIFRLNFTSSPSAPVQILTGDGYGAFRDSTSQIFNGNIPITSYVARALVRDINNDGVDDIYTIDSGMDVAPWTGGQNGLYLSDGKGFLKNATSQLPQIQVYSHGAAIGDINKDGLLDILDNAMTLDPLGAYSGNILKVQNQQGTFSTATNLFPNESLPNIFGSGSMIKTNTWSNLIDVNKDGYPDAILGTWTNNSKPSEVYLNKNGTFSNSVPVALPKIGLFKETVLQISPIDLNGDDLPDLLVSATNGGDSATETAQFYTVAYIQLLINKGNGAFVDETSQRLPQSKAENPFMNWYKYVFATDFNHDGSSDIVAIGSGNIGVTIFKNDGKGSFSKIFEAPNTYGYGAFADINNDGLDDVIMSNINASNITFWLNNNPSQHFYKANFGGDKLSGSKETDYFYSSSGEDFFDGRSGIDFALYNSPLREISVSIASTGAEIFDQNNPANVTDYLTNVERLRFTDTTIALDINGNAGQAYRLYQAALDRTPDERGLAGWIKFMDEGGALTTMAQQFIDSQEFRTKYGALDNRNFVNQLYLNVLDRNGEAAGITGWVNGLANGLTRADVLKGFSESSENQANVIGQIKNGIPYTEWWLS
jgi:hypothetical protein